MAYEELDNIRDEAGFTDNDNVSDAKITAYQSAATSHIDGIISRVYTLPLSETPEIITLIERKLAAGHLLLDEYGEQAEGTSKDGQAKVDWAEEMLQQIEDGTIRLIGADDTALAQSEITGMKGFPNDDAGTDKTATADKDDPPITEIGMKF